MIRNNQNRRRRSGSGPRPQQLAGGNNYGNRLDNRQRGNASQLLEKYRGLARDSQQAGDRVTAEYYLQYAEHYYRVLGDYRDRQGEPARRPRDYEDEDSAGFSDQEMDGDGDEDDGESRRERRPESRSDNRQDGRNDGRADEERQWRNERQSGGRGQSERRDGADRDGANRERSERDQPQQRVRDREWSREEPRAEGRREEPRREEIRGEVRRREDRRPPAPRPAPSEDMSEGPIPGLPGPATLSPRRRDGELDRVAPAPETVMQADLLQVEPLPVTETPAGEDVPAPRRRGRPRKVVIEAN